MGEIIIGVFLFGAFIALITLMVVTEQNRLLKLENQTKKYEAEKLDNLKDKI